MGRHGRALGSANLARWLSSHGVPFGVTARVKVSTVERRGDPLTPFDLTGVVWGHGPRESYKRTLLLYFTTL